VGEVEPGENGSRPDARAGQAIRTQRIRAMKVHISQIPPEGKHYEGEDPNTLFELNEEKVKPVGPVTYSLDVGLSEDGLFATGDVGAEFDLECVRCLETFRYPARVPNFACHVELTGAEEVDLTDLVREDILLVLPPHPHCDWNGERECPGATTPAALSDATDELPGPDVWGVLDQLKPKS
jgi:uncharacterized metal-binding protein YceD (DUF177 family)